MTPVIYFLLLSLVIGIAIFGAVNNSPSSFLVSGTVCLIAAAFVLSSGIQIHSGWDNVETQVDSNTTELVQNKTYTTVQEKSSTPFIRESFSIVFLASGLYFLLLGASGASRRSS